LTKLAGIDRDFELKTHKGKITKRIHSQVGRMQYQLVKVDGENVDGLKYSVNKDDELVISFDELTIEMNKSKLFVISASLEDFDDYGDAVAYYFKRTSDVNAVEKKTGARLDVTGTALSGALAKVHTFNGGKVKLSNTKLGKIDASQGSE
jgi:hypothetical protein